METIWAPFDLKWVLWCGPMMFLCISVFKMDETNKYFVPLIVRHFSILVATDHNAVHYGENQRDGISEQPLCDISITVCWENVLPPHRLRTVLLFYCINQNHLKRENISQFICLFIYFLAVSIMFCPPPPKCNTPERRWKLRHSVCLHALQLIGVTVSIWRS